MNYFDVLFAKKQSGGGETPTLITKTITENGTYNASEDNADGYSQVTVAVDGFKKKSIANTPTDIASFDDGTANPMPSLEIGIVPVQSGSGDPSPSNVRPISGWSGANVARCGVNVWDEEWENGAIQGANGLTYEDSTKIRSKNYISVLPNTTYYIKMPYAFNYAWYDAKKQYISGDNSATPNYIRTSPSNARYLRFSTAGTTYNNDISINYPSTDTSYHAYNGLTLSIPFHDSSDNPITVYGGTLNVTSGELTVTMANVDLGTLTWDTISGAYYARLSDKAYGVGNLTCENYPTYTATPSLSDMPDKMIKGGSSNNNVYVKDSTYSTLTAFRTAMSGVHIIYELATPQTYQLTPAQVTTLLGHNNIFADCGQILEGEYFVTL